MPVSQRVSLTAALALLVLALYAGLAAATDYVEVTAAGEVTLASLGKLTFSGGGGADIACNVTFTGSLEGTYVAEASAEAGAEMGSITSFSTANCSGGSVERALSLPWTLRFNSTSGSMPEEVTGQLFGISGFAINFSTFFEFVNCLYAGTPTASVEYSGSSPFESGLVAFLGARLAFVRGSELCPGSVTLRGRTDERARRRIVGQRLTLTSLPGYLRFAAGVADDGTVTIWNAGLADQSISRVEMRNATSVSIREDAMCRGRTLRPGERCTITLHYNGGAQAKNILQLYSAGEIIGIEIVR